MRQATKKQQKTKRFTAKQIVLTSIAAVVAIVLAFIAYQKYLDYADKRRFSELKADMLSLQTEFNKIEPGWEYSEGCRGDGGVYTNHLPAFCEAGLYMNSPGVVGANDKDEYLPLVEWYIGEVTDEWVGSRSTIVVGRSGFRESNRGCAIELSDKPGGENYIRCSHSSRFFHFERVD